jgi:hypothetical protein
MEASIEMSRMKLIIVSILIVLAASAVASASVSALHWRFQGARLPEGQRLNVMSVGGISIFKTKAHGIKIEKECKKELDKGWIENPVGGGNGVDLVTSEFEECEVLKPAGLGCTVKEPIVIKANTELVTIGGAIWDKFTPDPAGEPFVVLILENCTGSAAVLNGSYNLEGKTNGKVENSTSTLKFSATENDELTFAGESETFEGEVETTTASEAGMTGGEHIEVE